MGLSDEIGAFIGGVALASNPISLYITDSLKPLRDFFLVIFFFTIGASFNFNYLSEVIKPALTLAIFMLLIKPVVFSWLLQRSGESKSTGHEVGVRLGQVSEFSLLVAFLALKIKLITPMASFVIQAATIITFIISSYWVVLRYPTPLASNDLLRRD
jgi:predicted Kef-type K+ transport protein